MGKDNFTNHNLYVNRFTICYFTFAKKVYINEINSIPGSLAFYLWDAKDINFTQVLDDMINIGIKDYKKRMSKTHSFESNILQGFASRGGVKGMKGAKGKIR